MGRIHAWLWFALALSCAPAHAQLYGDWWNTPGQNGTGVNIGHEGKFVFMAWFTYDDAGDGMWLVMGGPLSGNTLAADIVRTTAGPPLGSPYAVADVKYVTAGHGTLTFADPFNASLAWTIGGHSGTLPLVRETFGVITLSGSYPSATQAIASADCGPDLSGLFAFSNDIVAGGGTFSDVQTTDGDFQFRFSGPLVQQGRWVTSQGTYTGGTSGIPFRGGPFSMQVLPIDDAIYMNEVQGSTKAGCQSVIYAVGLQ